MSKKLIQSWMNTAVPQVSVWLVSMYGV